MADKKTVKQWFKTGMIPTQDQFWSFFDSIIWNDEKVPITSIDGLDDAFQEKADAEALTNHLGDQDAHEDLFLGKEDKDQKGAANGYAPLDEFIKIESEYLSIVNDLVTGGETDLLSAEQGKVLKEFIDGKVSIFSTISELTSYTGSATAATVTDLTRGGNFIFVSSGLTTDNGVVFTATGKGSGYWVRQYEGAYVNAQWFPNVVANGGSDCAAGINAIPDIYTYRYFPAGEYLLNSSINISGDLNYWSFIGDDTPMKTENKGTVFLASFSGNVFDTGNSYSYEGIQFKNFQIWHVTGGYGIRSGWPETRIENVRMLLEYGNGINIAYVSDSNGAFDCTLSDVKIEGRFTDTPVTYSGTGLYVDSGSNNLLFTNSFLYGFNNAIIIKGSENVNIIQNNLNANGGDYAINVLDVEGTTNLNIENNYIESQNRAIYVGQATGVHVVNNQISEAGFGGFDNLADAHLYFDANTTSVSLLGNTVISSFQNQSFVYSPNDITLNDNHWTRNRAGSTFLGINFAIPIMSWQRDVLLTITSGSVVTNIRRLIGDSGYFSGNLSSGGARYDLYPLLVRGSTDNNFRVNNNQIAFVDDADAAYSGFYLGEHWIDLFPTGVVRINNLSGTEMRTVVVDENGDLLAIPVLEFADNVAALSAGLSIGAQYRTGDILKVVH